MQVKGAKQVHYDAGPNMTPLVDVVLVILIFMMLVGKFGGNEHYLSSTVPITKTGTGGRGDKVPDTSELRIRVDSLNDRFSARVGDNAASDKATLTAILAGKLAEFNAAGTPADKVQVIIEPSRTIKYMYLIQVYEAALDAKMPKIAITSSHS